jgi:NADH-quinone oxidoreductase subunit L
VTFPVFLAGALAISGVPFLSGFFSKDAILTSAYAGGHHVLYGLGLLGAVLTALYMFRLVYLTFYGEERFELGPGQHVHESPRAMTFPLVVLAVFSVLAGTIGLPVFFGAKADRFSRFLESVLRSPAHHPSLSTEALLVLAATASALLGIFLAFVLYKRNPEIPPRLAYRFPGLYRLLVGKYRVDEAYDALFIRPLVRGSETVYARFDLKIVDGTLNGSAAAAGMAGKGLNVLQTGLICDYALAFVLGAVVFLGVLLL